MSIGEKRLQSLINATVSHEMRNPLNSIHVQVSQIKMLNEEMKELLSSNEDLPESFVSSAENILQKYKDSYKIQKSSERLLNFLVDDILDYAQIGAGKFRERISRFKLQKSVNQIIKILQFKAQSLDITLKTNYKGFEEQQQKTLIEKVEMDPIFIHQDQQRLQ